MGSSERARWLLEGRQTLSDRAGNQGSIAVRPRARSCRQAAHNAIGPPLPVIACLGCSLNLLNPNPGNPALAENQYDITVVGAGIIGLSTALTLLQRHPGLKIAVLEKGGDIAQQQTGHNSGVIHSGIYYRPGSFKAQYCVEGRASMVKFCQENEIPYR
ncbi:MAG: FAD-dependent oxidoreductase [Chloroflexi bacterium]|nr:FAD-dependent oxidoreductase [Chloroflexota bacterium]